MRSLMAAYELDPRIWKACGGISVQIPVVDSRVYYFPQGHAEQASSTPDFSRVVNFVKPSFLCRIVSVKFLANQETDEVFAKIRLQPIDESPYRIGFLPSSRVISPAGVDEGQDENISAFAKVLTTSDANNGGGFSVPRFCAESIFPPLNYKADVPVQTISVRDVHGVVWEFRHIFRGTPRRHLLTTGWSKFVNHKKLVAGDSVVFMKNQKSGELWVGIRRKVRVIENVDFGRWGYQNLNGGEEEGRTGEMGFSRSVRGKVSAESVLEAVELAGQKREFEVVWYPKACSVEYVVKAEKVDQSRNIYWQIGMVIKMQVEMEDSRMNSLQGIISSPVTTPDHGPWRNSPWRMLQITWDDPKALQNVKRVSPWQVELVTTTPFPPTKRLCGPQNPEFLTDGNGARFSPMTGLTAPVMGAHINSPLYCNYFPAGMQGARQDPICVSGVSNPVGSNTSHVLYSEQGISPADNLSPNSQNSVHYDVQELLNNQADISTMKTGNGSIMLFGQVIHQDQRVETGFDDSSTRQVDGVTGDVGTVGLTNPLDPSLLDALEAQCEVADVESFPL